MSSTQSEIDDSLTSLHWLQNLNIMGRIGSPTPPTPPASPVHFDDSPIPSMVSQRIPSSPVAKKRTSPVINFATDDTVKPPFSYANLICMAMQANSNKMTLSAIYKWIRDNFKYYQNADPGWQNSIRHNLSLNKCFIKIPRRKDEPGKGGFWKLDPNYANHMVDGTFKKRKISPTGPLSSKPQGKRKSIDNKNVVLGISPKVVQLIQKKEQHVSGEVIKTDRSPLTLPSFPSIDKSQLNVNVNYVQVPGNAAQQVVIETEQAVQSLAMDQNLLADPLRGDLSWILSEGELNLEQLEVVEVTTTDGVFSVQQEAVLAEGGVLHGSSEDGNEVWWENCFGNQADIPNAVPRNAPVNTTEANTELNGTAISSSSQQERSSPHQTVMDILPPAQYAVSLVSNQNSSSGNTQCNSELQFSAVVPPSSTSNGVSSTSQWDDECRTALEAAAIELESYNFQ